MDSSDESEKLSDCFSKKVWVREIKMSHLINVEVSMPKLESSRREVKNYSFLFEEHKKLLKKKLLNRKYFFHHLFLPK